MPCLFNQALHYNKKKTKRTAVDLVITPPRTLMTLLTTPRLLLLMSLAVTVTHIFPVVATPVTGITLATFMDFSYGVFGWCYTRRLPSHLKFCTKRRIGYRKLNTHVYGDILYLPSESKYSISRLMVVHIIAFINSVVLSGMTAAVAFTRYGDSPAFVLATALVSLPLFIFSLFCFLVDILLFATHLDWPGWLMLVDTIVMAFGCSLLWSWRRTVSIRAYEALETGQRFQLRSFDGETGTTSVDGEVQHIHHRTAPDKSNLAAPERSFTPDYR